MSLKVFKKIALLVFFSFAISMSFADLPPDPGGGAGGPAGPPVGGGSPIGGGLIITLVLSGIYGTKKAIQYRKQ